MVEHLMRALCLLMGHDWAHLRGTGPIVTCRRCRKWVRLT